MVKPPPTEVSDNKSGDFTAITNSDKPDTMYYLLSFCAVRNVKMVFLVDLLYILTSLAVFIQALQRKPE